MDPSVRWAVSVALVTLCGAAGAQDRGLQYALGGGAAVPLGEAGKRFATGWNLSASVGYPASDVLALRAGYHYGEFELEPAAPLEPGTQARHKLQVASVDVVLAPRSGGVRPYLLVGPALYVRETEITRFLGTSATRFCDPWVGFCATRETTREEVVGRRSVTDFGFGVGAGVDFKLSGSARVFVEGRFNQVFGHDYDTPAGRQKANARYVPLVVGLRF